MILKVFQEIRCYDGCFRLSREEFDFLEWGRFVERKVFFDNGVKLFILKILEKMNLGGISFVLFRDDC